MRTKTYKKHKTNKIFVTVIEELVNVHPATIELWMHAGGCQALKKPESHEVIAECDYYASFVLSDLSRASI